MYPVQNQIEIEYVGLCVHNRLPNCTGYMKGFFTHASRGDRCDCGEGYLIQKHYRDCICEQCGDTVADLTNRWCLICNDFSRLYSQRNLMSKNYQPLATATERLVKAMQQSQCPDWLIEKAKTDYYHDYKSPLPAPEIQLVAELMKLEKEELADRVIAGEFDASKEEADEWFREEGQFYISKDMAIAIGFEMHPQRPKPRGFGKV